jgi:hypothetical protein
MEPAAGTFHNQGAKRWFHEVVNDDPYRHDGYSLAACPLQDKQ